MEEELERYRKALQEIVALGPTLRSDINQDRLHQVHQIAQKALLHKGLEAYTRWAEQKRTTFKLYWLNVDGDRDELEGEYNSRYDAVMRAAAIMYEDYGQHHLRLGGDGVYMTDLWFVSDEDYAVLEIVEEKA